jgi:3'-phosphoadenosine 5'-phosphosulfate sulfotransferase (PAPS reductase)/FAD synthetase
MKPFASFRWIVVNSSGGKDSQTALRVVVEEANRQGYPLSRIVVSHQCLGHVEWRGTLDLVKVQAEHYGLRLEVSKYRTKEGVQLGLLDYVRKRGKWPSSSARYCTSDFKRGPGGRVVTKLYREAAGDVLQVFGFRAQESPARAAKAVYARNERLSNQSRDVIDWLPIHEWNEAQVWASIKESRVPYHGAYDLGMPRLSCVFCIFAPKAALMVAGRENPELLDEYVKVEEEIGHTFQNGRSLKEIQQAIAKGEEAGSLDGNWNM